MALDALEGDPEFLTRVCDCRAVLAAERAERRKVAMMARHSKPKSIPGGDLSTHENPNEESTKGRLSRKESGGDGEEGMQIDEDDRDEDDDLQVEMEVELDEAGEDEDESLEEGEEDENNARFS